MDDQDLSPQAEGRARKRLRTSHACDVCRSRKIRCDGNTPCASCAAGQQECTYGSEANSRGKSDLILESVLRVEKLLYSMKGDFTSPSLVDRRSSCCSRERDASQPGTSEAMYIRPQAMANCPRIPASEATQDSPEHSKTGQNSFENAVLDSMHTSTTESILQWPHFDVFPSLRNDYVSIFELEQSRPAITMAPTSLMTPFISDQELDEILEAFENNVNFWYPTMSRHQLDRVRLMVKCFNAGVEQEYTIESCLAHLTMALGCASQTVAGLTSPTTPLTPDDLKQRARHRETGDLYFDHALRRLHTAHTALSSLATQCLFFTATYFAFLRRPLQAWEYINAASAKCLLLLSYPPRTDTPDAQERLRRIFWSCYILESDYLAELSALPPSGISRIESSVPLPGGPTSDYPTHAHAAHAEQASLYLLACISMRRLLNRVHQLLYARDTGAYASSPARFAQVVAELDRQLEKWRGVLPAAFAFAVDTGSTATEAGGFLRQRYLTCRSVIYRPYLMWMLSGGGGDGMGESKAVLDGCRACLEACLLHVLNLRGFAQTVLVDTWICSLSMAGAMLILLASSRIPALKGVLGPEMLTAGDHLRQLLTGWQRVAGQPSSPSVDQSVKVIGEADEFIKQVFAAGDMLALYGQGSEAG